MPDPAITDINPLGEYKIYYITCIKGQLWSSYIVEYISRTEPVCCHMVDDVLVCICYISGGGGYGGGLAVALLIMWVDLSQCVTCQEDRVKVVNIGEVKLGIGWGHLPGLLVNYH